MKSSITYGRRAQAVGAALCCIWLRAAFAQPVPEVTLTRLDCGNEPEPASVAAFSDTYAYTDLKLKLTYSCYLIRHGDDYMVWDTGNALGQAPESPGTPLVALLGQLRLTPEQIKYVVISHYDDDHIGQAASLPHSTLLIGRGDLEVLTAAQPPRGMSPEAFASRRAPFAPWISGGSKVEPLTADKKDVFGDGTVVMLSTPGHTPGHHALLVRLKERGNVLLSVDCLEMWQKQAALCSRQSG